MTSDQPPRFDYKTAWIMAGLFVAVLAVYAWTLAPGMVRGDGAELQFTLARGGVAHPTGYPLYTLLGWLWAHVLPFGSMAWRINLLSAVAGAGAVALTYAIGYRLTRRVLPALAGALLLAFSPTFWTQSSITEVYALHILFVAAVLYLLLLWRDAGPRRPRFLVATAFVYGLSLSHHRTMLLLAPAILVFLVLEEWAPRLRRGSGARTAVPNTDTDTGTGKQAREGQVGRNRSGGTAEQRVARSVRSVLVLSAAFLAGLLPYLHIFVHQLSRGRTVQHIVWNVILGGDFVGFLGLRSNQLYVLWDLPRQQVGLFGLAVAAIGLVWLAWKQRSVAWLLGLSYAANVAFCLFYRVPDIPVFAIPGTLVLAVWAGASAGFLASLIARMARPSSPLRRVRSRVPAFTRYTLELALVLVAMTSFRHLPAVQGEVSQMDGDIEQQTRDLLAYPFEPGAIVIGSWDTTMAARWLRTVEGVQADVRVIAVHRECEWLIQALNSGGPVYMTPEVQITRLPEGYQFEEAQQLGKITTRPAAYTRLDLQLHPQVTLEGVQRQGQLLILRWLVTGAPLAEDYSTYVHFFDAEGQPLGQQDKGIGEATCWYPPTTWPPGEVMQDLFILPAGTASIRTGLYAVHEGQIEPLGTDATFALP
jgi:hypothetical protein